jgi:hypothetical protein
VPSDVRETRYRANHFLSFSVAGHSIEYDGAMPRYQEIRSALQSGRPIRVWVSPAPEAPIPIGNHVTLYQLTIDDKPVLTYAETVAHSAKAAPAGPLVGAAIIALGALVTCSCLVKQRRYEAWKVQVQIPGA